MDKDTGEILTFKDKETLELAMKTRNLEELHGLPNPKCKKCYGLGHLGRDTITNEFIVCRCCSKKRQAMTEESDKS